MLTNSDLESTGFKIRTPRQRNPFFFFFGALCVLAWRIPGMGEPGGLPSLGSHRVGHDWSDLAAAAFILDHGLPPGKWKIGTISLQLWTYTWQAKRARKQRSHHYNPYNDYNHHYNQPQNLLKKTGNRLDFAHKPWLVNSGYRKVWDNQNLFP